MIEEGDVVLLLGKRRIVVRVMNGMGRIGSGTADLSRLIGMEYGDVLNLWGQEFTVYPASLDDIVSEFERGPQVILPKDAARIIRLCDMKAGDTVLEAGVGSGWMSAAILHSIMPGGRLVSYDISDRSISVAEKNLKGFGFTGYEIRKGDVRSAGIDERFSSVVLDMPAPWEALPNISSVLVPGGHLCAYVPTFNQVERTVLAMKEGFFEIGAMESIERDLSVKEGATRPAYNGLMHTGFIIHGRKR